MQIWKRECLHFLLWLTVNYWTVEQQMRRPCCKLFQMALTLSYGCVGMTVCCLDGWELYWDFWKRFAFSVGFVVLCWDSWDRHFKGGKKEEKTKPLIGNLFKQPPRLKHSRFQKVAFISSPPPPTSNVYRNTNMCSSILDPIITVVFVTKCKMCYCYWPGVRWLRG